MLHHLFKEFGSLLELLKAHVLAQNLVALVSPVEDTGQFLQESIHEVRISVIAVKVSVEGNEYEPSQEAPADVRSLQHVIEVDEPFSARSEGHRVYAFMSGHDWVSRNNSFEDVLSTIEAAFVLVGNVEHFAVKVDCLKRRAQRIQPDVRSILRSEDLLNDSRENTFAVSPRAEESEHFLQGVICEENIPHSFLELPDDLLVALADLVDELAPSWA